MELNEADFVRLRLKTKIIKSIQRIQKELKSNSIVEELEINKQISDFEEKEQTGNTESDGDNGTNSIDEPYRDIFLEEEINIDKIFKRTRAGKDIIEILKEGAKPSDGCLKSINNILCEFLKSTYGLRPSSYHKNMLAMSLVKSYPVLASSNDSVPQALWFHPHARGLNKHSGRLHYHMEYLVRKSNERLIHRKKKVSTSENVDLTCMINTASEDQIEQMRSELKFICPEPATKERVEELWMATFQDRQNIRKTDNLLSYLKDYPAASAFNGKLITTEFGLLNPGCLNFGEKFQSVQCQIVTEFNECFRHITNDFLRALAIIRMKNPSRGAKRLRVSGAANDNPLQGILEWCQVI
ncbi:uncharacterized protein LOC131430963 isoform X2 [Malaya genurostris]|uniref:uncharacterized protein LOC131430963 isoform X2 n=1 Tax=Malaya genurostris TaxID=325434 RepID=UPI0026F3B2C3|nr:uncharacterized protein LOC131430963 isoform X2 [Malaya genurostris]